MAYDRLVMLDDYARSLTFTAGQAISGGDLVGFSSGTDVVTSGGNFGGYQASEILVDAGSVTDENFIGIAETDAASGTEVSVLMNGVFVLPAGSSGITGGDAVVPAGYENMVNVTPATGSIAPIGRALTSATALTGFALVKLL